MAIEQYEFRTWNDLQNVYANVKWLWPEWLPVGYVTMLAADPGVGKSMLALTVCHIVTNGGEWLDRVHRYDHNPNDLIAWVECEAGEPFHIIRSKSIGMDMTKVLTMRTHEEDVSTPSLTNATDKARLRAMMELPNVRLVVIDSLSGASQGVDENSAESGRVVQWVADQARDCGKAVLLIHHMNKGAMRVRGTEPPTMADIRGSTAIQQYCRAIWTLDVPNASDPESLRLAMLKSNLGKRPHPIRLLIDPTQRIVSMGAMPAPSTQLRSGQYRDDWEA